MTCTCKAEIASVLRDEARLWDAADDKNLARAFVCVADRLSPAETPQEPLTGWRAECEIDERNPGDWRVVWNPGRDGVWWLQSTGGWARCELLIPQRDASFPTESAARAALAAASEPGKEKATEPPKCMYCGHDLMASEIGACGRCVPQPSPSSGQQAFDAEKIAGRMVVVDPHGRGFDLLDPNGRNAIAIQSVPGGPDHWTNLGAAERVAEIIAAALRAAHEAGQQEARTSQSTSGK